MRLPAVLAAVPVAVGLGGAAPARSEGLSASVPKVLRVDAEQPDWLAPGGRLHVSGWTRASVVVRLRVGTGTVVATRSGRFGRFRLEVRAPRRAGRFAVSVEAEGRRLSVGPLRVRALILAAVGDVTFGDRVASEIAARGPRQPWLRVADTLRSADVATANLESAVSTRGTPVAGKEYHFRGPPRALSAAAGFAGLDVVSVANNHALDFGRDAFLDTLRHAERLDLGTVGGGRDLTAARRPVLLERGGLRVAFLGYSDVRPLGFDAGYGLPGTAPARPELIGADVNAARRRADLVVVWFHWGAELETEPSWRQQQLAAAALNAGATVVLGAHPHVLQRLTAVPSRRLVAWSLGNFVFPAASPGTTRTGILLVRLSRRGVEGYRLEPARIHGVQPRLERT